MGMLLSCCGQAASDVEGHDLPQLGGNAADETDFAQQVRGSDARLGQSAAPSQQSSVLDIAEPAGTIGEPRSTVRIYGDDEAPVRCASPFRTADDAAWFAINAVLPQSVRANAEYGGLIYRRPDKGTFGVTGPVTEGKAASFLTTNPLVRVPPDTNIAGAWHTHGDYSEEDPLTGAAIRAPDASRDGFYSDRFSPADIALQARIAHGPKGLSPEQLDAWYIRNFGAPPTEEEMHFYLGTPSGDIRVHTPSQLPTAATAVRHPRSNAIMDGYGTDIVLPRRTTG